MTDYEFNNKGMWNPKYFPVISIFFSFYPVVILYLINSFRVENKRNRIIKIIATTIFISLYIFIINKIKINSIEIIFIIVNISVGWLLRVEQEKKYYKHISFDGKKESYKIPIVILVILTIAILYNDNKNANSILLKSIFGVYDYLKPIIWGIIFLTISEKFIERNNKNLRVLNLFKTIGGLCIVFGIFRLIFKIWFYVTNIMN